jgi:ABC-type enterochelin transport system substrate-binding protein
MKIYRSIFWLFILLILTACGNATDEGVIVTFRVADQEQYKIQLTDPADIATAQKLLAGEEAPKIPNGVIVYGDPGVNEGYSWHIDPESLEFADFTTEVCDGLPSDVEQGILTSDRYCPWAAEVIAIDE